MALAPVDFSNVDKQLVGSFNGQAIGWDAQPTKAGDSTNIIVTFEFQDDEGNPKKHTQFYNLKPTALWRLKRDFIAMGAEPEEFEGTDVDLESICNDLFNPPGVAVKMTLIPGQGRFSDLDKVEAF